MRLQALKEHDTEVSLSLFLSFSLSLFLSLLSLFLSLLSLSLSVRMHFAKWLQRGPPVLNRRVYGAGILQASRGAQEREAHERDHADRRLPPQAWEPGPHASLHSAPSRTNWTRLVPRPVLTGHGRPPAPLPRPSAFGGRSSVTAPDHL